MNDFRAAPNQLTFLRLCLVPFLVLAILDGHYRTAATLFFVAGITDGLDGLLARLLHQRTVLGQYLDPVADKLLLSTAFLVLNHQGLISRRVTVLVFGRDLGILVVSAILYVSIGMRDFRPSIYGKANTLAQIIALSTVLVSQFYAPQYHSRRSNSIVRGHHGADYHFWFQLCVEGRAKAERRRRSSRSASLILTARPPTAKPSLLFELGFLAFDLHVAEFAGLEDLAAILAFDIFRILVAGDDSDSGVGAGRVHGILVTEIEEFRSDCTHSRPLSENFFSMPPEARRLFCLPSLVVKEFSRMIVNRTLSVVYWERD